MRLLFFFLLATAWLSGCSQEHSQPEVNANTSFELSPDNTVRLKDENADFPVKVLQIQDSRCPMDANCIWMGEAKVEVLISDNETASLCLGDCLKKDPKANEAHFSLNDTDYLITLNDVQPYPSASVSGKEAKKAVLTIKRVTL